MKLTPKFGLTIVPSIPSAQYVSFAKRAEDYGIEYLWMADENPSPPYRDVFMTLATIAAKTEKIRLGTNVCNPFTRHPALTAVATLTLDEISDGRAILGLAAGGTMTLPALGFKLWEKPVKAVREATEATRRLFAGETVSYDGEIVKMNSVKLFSKPRSRIPIYYGVRGPQMLRLTGELADGGLIHTCDGYLEFAIEQIKLGAQKSGRSINEIDMASIGQTGISEDVEDVAELAKVNLTYQIPDCPDILLEKTNIRREEAERIRTVRREEGVSEAVKLVSRRMVDALTIVGKPETVIDIMVERFRKGVTQMIFSHPYGSTPDAGLKLIGEVVIPGVKSKLARS